MLVLGALGVLLKCKKFFKLVAGKFHIPKYKELLVDYFSFLSSEIYFLGCKNFSNLGARKFHFRKYKKFFRGRVFFVFSKLGLKVLRVAFSVLVSATS